VRRVYIQAKELYGVLFAKYATHINSTVDLGLNREKRRGRFANCRAISPPGPAGGHRPRLARWTAAWAGLMQPGWAAAGAWPACCRALGRRAVGHLAGLLPRCWPSCAAGPFPPHPAWASWSPVWAAPAVVGPGACLFIVFV